MTAGSWILKEFRRSQSAATTSRPTAVCLAIFAHFQHVLPLLLEFVLSSFFDTFVEATGLIEFVPSILTSFSNFIPVSIVVSLKSFYHSAASRRARKSVRALLRIRSTFFRFFWRSF
jgi:hypothetical protein